MRIPQIFLLFAALAPVIPVTANGASELDVDYAEHLPLVTQSMLLDVTRAGDKLIAVGERGHVIFSSDLASESETITLEHSFGEVLRCASLFYFLLRYNLFHKL